MSKRKRETKEPKERQDDDPSNESEEKNTWNLHHCRRLIFRGPNASYDGSHGTYQEVHSLDYHEELKLLVEGCMDGTARCFDEESGTLKWKTNALGSKVIVTLIGPARDRVLCCAPDFHRLGTLALLELKDGTAVWKLNVVIKFHTLVHALDDALAIIQQKESAFELSIIDIAQGAVRATIPLERECPIYMDDQYLYAELDCIKVWKLQDGAHVADLPYKDPPLSGKMAAHGGKIAYVTKLQELIVTGASASAEYRAQIPDKLFECYGRVAFVVFDGKNVLLYSEAGAWLWDLQSEPKFIPIEDHNPLPLYCNLEGDFAILVDLQWCRLFDARTARLLLCIPDGPGPSKNKEGWMFHYACIRGCKLLLGCDNDLARIYDFESSMRAGTPVWARRAKSNPYMPARVEDPPKEEVGREDEVYVYLFGLKIFVWLKNEPLFVVPYDEMPMYYDGAIRAIRKNPKVNSNFKKAISEAGWILPS